MWKFIKSSSSIENWYEHEGNEVCFFGRSNVGKSSLINALTNNKKMAKVSNTPGRTQLINYFETNSNLVVVDLPGYGYAKMPIKLKEKMHLMIDDYFKKNKKLLKVFLLFDLNVGLLKEDYEVYEYINSLNIEIILIGTKLDKLNQSRLHKIKSNEFLKDKKCYFVSSQKRKNIDHLLNYVENI